MNIERIRKYCSDCGLELEILMTLSHEELEQIIDYERLYPPCRAFVSGIYYARLRDVQALDAEILAHNAMLKAA